MGRPKKQEQNETTILEEVIAAKPKADPDIEEMPLTTLGEYLRYNEKARKLNHKLGVCRYKIKQCPEELHPKQRIQFMRKDQPKNPLPVFLSDEKIHFEKTLIPGQTYDLPLCVVDYLAGKGYPIWERFEKPDGSWDTQKVGMDPRFALRTIYAE